MPFKQPTNAAKKFQKGETMTPLSTPPPANGVDLCQDEYYGEEDEYEDE